MIDRQLYIDSFTAMLDALIENLEKDKGEMTELAIGCLLVSETETEIFSALATLESENDAAIKNEIIALDADDGLENHGDAVLESMQALSLATMALSHTMNHVKEPIAEGIKQAEIYKTAATMQHNLFGED